MSVRHPLADIPDLASAVADMRSARGSRLAREALELLDGAAESPKESELRILLLSAGIGPLASNPDIYDDSGRWIARVDLALEHLRIAVEYEGDHHRDRMQWQRDIARRRRIEAAGWKYLSVTQQDVTDPRALLADLRAAVRSRS